MLLCRRLLAAHRAAEGSEQSRECAGTFRVAAAAAHAAALGLAFTSPRVVCLHNTTSRPSPLTPRVFSQLYTKGSAACLPQTKCLLAERRTQHGRHAFIPCRWLLLPLAPPRRLAAAAAAACRPPRPLLLLPPPPADAAGGVHGRGERSARQMQRPLRCRDIHDLRSQHSGTTPPLELPRSSSPQPPGSHLLEVGAPDANGAVLAAAGVGGAVGGEAHVVHRAVVAWGWMKGGRGRWGRARGSGARPAGPSFHAGAALNCPLASPAQRSPLQTSSSAPVSKSCRRTHMSLPPHTNLRGLCGEAGEQAPRGLGKGRRAGGPGRQARRAARQVE